MSFDIFMLGIDIGSSGIHLILLNNKNKIVFKYHNVIKGQPFSALTNSINQIPDKYKSVKMRVGVTGVHRANLEHISELFLDNEIIALSRGISYLYPTAKSCIEIGGQSSRWIQLEKNDSSQKYRTIVDYAQNEQCAAGSGIFIEQQASRLCIPVEEFSKLAVNAKYGSSVAGRCSVFAKSDMIHLQQKGTPVDEIAYGLCQALARNFMATVLKGRRTGLPVVFTGGGMLNKGLDRAFREVLEISNEMVIDVEDPQVISSFGAALGASSFDKIISLKNLIRKISQLKNKQSEHSIYLPALKKVSKSTRLEPKEDKVENIELYLGVDVGSVSTNFVLIDKKGEVVFAEYLRTRGRPVEVLQEGLKQIKENISTNLNIKGVATTGSGRYLAAKFLGGDIVKNEITCQYYSSVFYYPEVDTIFEIGGQDSKYIGIKSGKIVDFEMNKICAAGTGSFLEEQAEHLEIDIKKDFSDFAVNAKRPIDLGCRCTVFMETELVNSLQQGKSVSEISAGLAYSVARNYLERVVENRPVGKNVVFQGGTASNAALVSAFENLLGRPILVHPYNRVSGAIGAALLARDNKTWEHSLFRGIDAIKNYSVKSFECKECTNRCQVNMFKIADSKVFFGDACEKFSSIDNKKKDKNIPDLFNEFNEITFSYIKPPIQPVGKIGIPRASIFFENIPFWAVFFQNLGYEVVVSDPTNMRTLEAGLKRLPAETCLPIKVTVGHVQLLGNKGVDWVFLPSIIDLHDEAGSDSVSCPYVQSFPYMIRTALDTALIIPEVKLNEGLNEFVKGMEIVADVLNLKAEDISESFLRAEAAQEEYKLRLYKRGEEVIEKFKDVIKVIVVGKPYNVADPFLNLNLGKHLKRAGVLGIPLSFLAINRVELNGIGTSLPWALSRNIVRGVVWSLKRDDVYPVFVSNFGCGPDGFMQKHISTFLKDVSHLFLEFDEHRGEAGLITRIEAFIDEVESSRRTGNPNIFKTHKHDFPETISKRFKNSRFVLPYFSDHAYAYAGILQNIGFDAYVMESPDEETKRLGDKYSCGKECHPYNLLTGDLIKYVQNFDKINDVFFYPGSSIPCLIQQYGEGQALLLKELGVDNMQVFAPAMEEHQEMFGMAGGALLWRGLIAIDILLKIACQLRPYEKVKGTVDRIHNRNLKEIEAGIMLGELSSAISRSVKRLESVKVDRKNPRPLIGVAGDMYTRINNFANEDLFSKLEEMGCEVWPAPFMIDIVDFSVRNALSKGIDSRSYQDIVIAGSLMLRKDFEKWMIKRKIGDWNSMKIDEPGYEDILKMTEPYIGSNINEILVLNIAKIIDFSSRGCHGIVNAICFNCMLGTVSSAITRKIRDDFNNIPITTICYTGSDALSQSTKLEAFVHQAKAYKNRVENLPN